MFTHIPVLLQQVREHIQPEPNKHYIDGTVGQGGHAEDILEHSLPDVRLLAFDRDARNLAVAQSRLAKYGDAVVFIRDSFANVRSHAYAHKFTHVDGILLDLGFSSAHVDEPERGFSFQQDGPLDMRYDTSQGETAADVVNTWEEDELAKIFRVYGEEPKARDIAEAIVSVRKQEKFTRTLQLAHMIESVVPRRGKTHPATKVFQALRIAVNTELDELERALPDMVDLLKPGGRLLIISFHSLEDRIVKRFFKEHPDLELVNKKVIVADQEEVKENPRARSAKLRVAEKR